MERLTTEITRYRVGGIPHPDSLDTHSVRSTSAPGQVLNSTTKCDSPWQLHSRFPTDHQRRFSAVAIRAKRKRAGNIAPVKRRYRHVVVHRIEDALREATGRGLVQPHAIGVGDRVAGEGAERCEGLAVVDVEQAAVLELVGRQPVAAAIRAGP